jgi:hypothetical protein
VALSRGRAHVTRLGAALFMRWPLARLRQAIEVFWRVFLRQIDSATYTRVGLPGKLNAPPILIATCGEPECV